MKNGNRIFAFAVVSALAFQSCANTALNRKIDSELAQETEVKSHSDLRNQTGRLIETAPGLTADQRSKLSTLRDSTRTQLDAMWAQSLKLRSLLLKGLVSAHYDVDEVELIKQRIRVVENKRLGLTFNAIEQASEILGHETYENRRRLMEEFFDGERGHINRF